MAQEPRAQAAAASNDNKIKMYPPNIYLFLTDGNPDQVTLISQLPLHISAYLGNI